MSAHDVVSSAQFGFVHGGSHWGAVNAADGSDYVERTIYPHTLKLHTEQESLDPKHLDFYRKHGPDSGDEMGGVPQIVEHEDHLQVVDGHHRLAVAAERKQPLRVEWYKP